MTLSITAGSAKTETFQCKSCPSAYMTQIGLDKHSEKQHASKEVGKVAKEVDEAKEIPLIPTTNKPQQKVSDFKCPKCSMLYLSKAGLEKHIDKEHKESEPSKPQDKSEPDAKKETIVPNARKKIPDFKCPKCPSIYLSQSGVDKHVEKEHKSDDSSTKPKEAVENSTGLPRRRMSTFNCLQCESKFLTRSGLDEHIQKEHDEPPKTKRRDEKPSKKDDVKELKMNETVIGFKASKSSKAKHQAPKVKIDKQKDIKEVDIEEVEDKPAKDTKSKVARLTKKPSKDDDIEEMEIVEEPIKKSSPKDKSKKKSSTKTNAKPTSFDCKKCTMKFLTWDGLDIHRRKKHGKDSPKKEIKPKEDKQEEEENGFAWPPETGSILATLFDDDFYLGKVLKVAANKTVKVQYMDRYKKSPKDAKDQYWVWPDKPDPPFQTARESILGINALIEKDDKYSTKQNTVYALNNHATWTRLGKSSRIGI